MKKVLYFIDFPLDLLGGAQLSTQTICDALSGNDSNMQVKVVTPKLMREKTQYNFPVIEYPNIEGGIKGLVCRLKEYKRIINIEKPDIVHAQMPLSAVVLCILKGLALIHTTFVFTDRALFNGYSAKVQTLFRLFAKQMDYVVCTTELNQHMWENIVNKDKIKLIYNSVSVEFMQRINSITRKENDSFCIGFAGRVTDFKDWPLCLRIVQAIKDKGVDITVACVMSAYTEAEKKDMQGYIENLETIVGKDHLKVWIDLSQSEMPMFYSQVDVFIQKQTL